MLKSILLIVVLLVHPMLAAQPTDYAKMVNPFIGTGGHGHTFPGATVPFGMVQLSPDTRLDGWDGCGGYHYSDSVIYGFSHTHLSGTGCSDYGDVLLMPMMDMTDMRPVTFASFFSHQSERAHAGYYAVKLSDEDIDVELTATTRVGFHKYTFNRNGEARILLNLLHRDKLLEGKILTHGKLSVEGYRRSEAWARDQRLYFDIEFSRPFKKQQIGGNDTSQTSAVFVFDVKKGETIYVKVSLSAVGNDGAKKNMTAELPGWDFEKTRKAAEQSWNNELGKIQVKGGTQDEQVIFYTALYHTFIQPNVYCDVDGLFRGRDMRIHKADFTYYSVFSLWDTFRAAHPLYNIVQRKRNSDFIKTFLKQYERGGRLPVWELSSNETDCMIGYNSVSVIADAYAKGVRDFDTALAVEAMKKSATWKHLGLPAYQSKGYLASEDEHESVSKNLEYAYDDWCIAQLCKGDDKVAFQKRSQSWKNLFDAQTGFMRPRYNGGWYTPFDPAEVNNHFTEANSWQYSFFVPHDVEGLAARHGGSKAFEKKLDELFTASSKTSGREQADITGLIGQYAHGNEPSHHMAYLYNYVGKPSKTQARTRQILKEMYHNAPDGLSGNEDCGQMSAWYVMSAMGLYAVCPGTDVYQLTTPLFNEVIIHTGNGEPTVIRTNGKGDFIGGISLNGSAYKNCAIRHGALFNGLGTKLEYNLSQTGSDELENLAATNPTAANIIPAPVISAGRQTFHDSLLITMHSLDGEGSISYTVNKEPGLKSYTGPFYISNTTRIKAFVSGNNGIGNFAEGTFYKIPHHWTVKLLSSYNKQYTAGGDEGIIDGLRGETDWRKGRWQGYQGQDVEAIIDLGREMDVSRFTAGFLQDSRAWIVFPKRVEFMTSTDGKSFTLAAATDNDIPVKDESVQTKDFDLGVYKPIKARYIKLRAYTSGPLPEGHLGAGGQPWIFVDEVEVR